MNTASYWAPKTVYMQLICPTKVSFPPSINCPISVYPKRPVLLKLTNAQRFWVSRFKKG